MRQPLNHWQAPNDDNEKLANVCGPLDCNLRRIEQALHVKINRRGANLSVQGDPQATQQTTSLINHFFENHSHQPLSTDTLELTLIELQNTKKIAQPKTPQTLPNLGKNEGPVLRMRKGDLTGRTDNQKTYLENILKHDLTFGIGPAGTGKTFLAVACALDTLERDQVQRIILTRPAVEAGERLGFLPGDLNQKVDPYLRPLYDALHELGGYDRIQKLFERNVIEIAPLAYMRGRTLNHAFVILDEAQNTTPEQMKMFLTRLGFGSKAVITGDVTQIDLPRGQQSGLIQAQQVLQNVQGIATSTFISKDVVRHPLVARIVEAYERHQRTQHHPKDNTPS